MFIAKYIVQNLIISQKYEKYNKNNLEYKGNILAKRD